MPYVYSISPTKACSLRSSRNRPIFSGGSHQRAFKTYAQKREQKQIVPAKYCRRCKVLQVRPGKQIFGNVGPNYSVQQNIWFAAANVYRSAQFARQCWPQYIALYKYDEHQYKQWGRKQFADKYILRPATRYRRKRGEELNSLSRRSKQKIRDKVLALWYQAQIKTDKNIRTTDFNKFQFVTLTFIDAVTDQKAVQLLNKFLTALRKKERVFYKWIKVKEVVSKKGIAKTIIKQDCENHLQYLWVVERQKNGNAHFHIIFNKRFDLHWCNAQWAKVQIDAGLKLKKYGEKTREVFAEHYKAGTVGEICNPYDTKKMGDINKTDSPDAVANYLTGYVTKNDGKFSCATWYCSRGISALETSATITARDYDHTKNETINRRQTKKGEYIRHIAKNEYCETVTIVNKKYYSKYLRELNQYNYWLLQMRAKERKENFCKVDPYGGQSINKREWLSQYAFIETKQYTHIHCETIETINRQYIREKMTTFKKQDVNYRRWKPFLSYYSCIAPHCIRPKSIAGSVIIPGN